MKFDLSSCLDNRLSSLGLEERQYAGLKNGTVRNFGESQLSKRVIRVGCDYLRGQLRLDRSRLMSIKMCAECVLLWRRNASDRELLRELEQELDAIIREADDKIEQYDNEHCKSQ